MKRFLLLFLFLSLTLPAQISFKQFQSFRTHASNRYAALALEEYNRAFHEAELLHGKLPVHDTPAREILRQLEEGGYLNLRIWTDFPMLELEFQQGKFLFSSVQSTDPKSYPLRVNLPNQMIKKGLVDSSIPVRLFSLEYLQSISTSKPVILALKGLLKETEPFIIQKYGLLLRSEGYVEKIPRKVPKSFAQKVKTLWKESQALPEKANALFLAIQYTDFKPNPEIPVLIHMMDNKYPIVFLIRLFSAYPRSLLEKFIVPFQEGYGDKWELLMEIFSHFTDSKPLLETLYYALEHRKEVHFASFEQRITTTWEKISGIPFEENLNPYRNWIDQKN